MIEEDETNPSLGNTLDLNARATHRGFASLIGVARGTVQEYVSSSIIPKGGTYKEWMLMYSAHARKQAQVHNNDKQEALTIAKTEEVVVKTAMQRVTYNERIGALIESTVAEQILGDWAAYAVREVENEINTLATKIEQSMGIEINNDLTNESISVIRNRITNHAEQLSDRLEEASSES